VNFLLSNGILPAIAQIFTVGNIFRLNVDVLWKFQISGTAMEVAWTDSHEDKNTEIMYVGLCT
jgi:hypothetical protein